MLHFVSFHYQNLYNTKSNMNKKNMGQISNNVPRKSPVGIFEEKGQTTFSRALFCTDYE